MMLARRLIEVMLLSCLSSACVENGERTHVINADPEQGREDLQALSCGVCHVIPGVPGARGAVGPTLQAYSRRVYVAGKFRNDPELLVRWIRDAPSLAPDTAMPAVDMSEEQARNMAAYLYTLK
jgi:cytochrome c